MKKFCILIIAAVLVLTLAACNNVNNSTQNGNTDVTDNVKSGADFVGE